ncbi:MAG: PAS domain S-box protein [Thermodesulfobacteriota bacterium]
MIFSRTDTEVSLPSFARQRVVVAVILAVIVLCNLFNIFLSFRLSACHNTQIQAINRITINVGAAHFLCDKILNGGEQDPRAVVNFLQEARSQYGVMRTIIRGNHVHRWFHPQGLAPAFDEIGGQLDTLLLMSRDSMQAVAAGGDPLLHVIELNKAFAQANQVITHANSLLWQAIRQEQEIFFGVQIFLALSAIFLACLTIVVFRRYDKGRKHALEAVADQRNQEQFLAQFSRFCRDTSTIRPVYELVTAWLAGHLGVDLVSIWRRDAEGISLSCHCLYDAGVRGHRESGMQLSCADMPRYSAALMRDEPIVAEDVRSHPATRELTDAYFAPFGIHSLLDIPLKLNGEIAGVLCLEVRHRKRRWTSQEIALCRAAADQISLALSRTYERERREEEQAAYAARLENEVRERTMALEAANTSLRDSEARLRLVFDKAPFGAALVNLIGHVLQVNEEFCRFLGYEQQALIEANFLRFLPVEGRLPFEENLSRLLTGEIDKFQMDSPYEAKGGKRVWGRTTIRLLRDESGKPLYFLPMVENISEQKSFENQLGKLHTAIEHSPLSIVITDPEGRIEYANPFFCASTGYALDEVIGQNPRVLKSDAHEPVFYQELWQTIKSGKTWRGEICNRKKDGSLYWEHAFIAPVTDKDGAIVSFIGVKENITEKKQLADELRTRTEMIASIASAAQSAIIMIDNQGLVTFWNKAAEEIFGWQRDEVLGRDLHELVTSEEHRQRFRAGFDQFRECGRGPAIGRHVELTAIRRGGAEFPAEISLSGVQIKGQWHAVGIVNDISERKEAQQAILAAKDEAEAANRAKSDFLARMSHEIRTPMNAIIGLSHLALEMELTAKLRDYLGKIASAGNNLLNIINDILDFSKIEARRLELAPHSFSLEKVLVDLAGVTAFKAQEKGLEFMFAVAPEVPDRLFGDSLRLGQVLVNLVSNAIKFTEKGEVIVRVALAGRSGDRVTLRFSVRDSGMGISEEQVKNLFAPFSQADGSISRNYGGTGLGLAISKRLVTLMGGDIEVESRPGEGSTFAFTVELNAGPEAAAVLPAAPADLCGLRVLVVEDHPVSREILVNVLRSFSFSVSAVGSGEEGLAAFDRANAAGGAFDVLVLDYLLPGIKGDALARIVRQRRDSAGRPKILMLTSVGAAKIVQRCLDAGCDSVLDKPVSRAALFDAIQGVCRGTAGGGGGVQPVARGAEWSRLAGVHVLLVEDNEINQEVGRALLQRAGVLVDVACSGEEAVAAVLDKEYDLVLMDIQMPGMDGLEATRRIRASGVARLVALPIVAMTAHAISGDEEWSLAAGMNDHVTKPIDPDTLFATMGKWLRKREVPAPSAMPACPAGSGGSDQASPQIPGLDLSLVVKRLGSVELCQAILRKFVEHYAGAAEEVCARIRGREWQEAAGVLHTLKGVVGTISAQSLYDLVVELEKGCKNAQPPAAARLAAFAEEHGRVIANVRAFLGMEPADPVTEQAAEPERLAGALAAMLPDIKAHRPVKCGEHLRNLKMFSWPSEHQVEVNRLVAAIENYQFKEAARLAEELIALVAPAGKA